MRLTREEIDARVAAAPVARLATLAPDGRPHLVPVVFARAGGFLWSPVDGKPKRGAALARLAHVRRDPRVALLLDHYEVDWAALWWVRLDGTAKVLVRPAPDHPELGPGAEALRAKYPQYRHVPLFQGPPTLLRIRVERARGWRASPNPS